MHPRSAYAQIRQVLLGFRMHDSLESTRSPDLQVWRCYLLLQNQLSRATSISFGDDVLGSGLALQDTLQKRLAQNFDPKRFKILPLHSQVRLVLVAVPWLVGINFGSHQTLNAHNRSGQQGSTILHFCTCYRLPISQKDAQTEFEVMLFPFFVKKGRISRALSSIFRSCSSVAQVTPQQQQEIFEPAPSGVRKIVLTTNIAEVPRATHTATLALRRG